MNNNCVVTPLVSIIIAVYNVEPYIRECLDSILNQTYKHWEAIVVDDGSTDDGGSITDEYASKDERFKVLHKSNGGLSSARNCGLDIALGDYIAFLDGDDYYDEHYLESLLEHINDDTIVCCGNIRFVDDRNMIKSKHAVDSMLILDKTDFLKFLLDGEIAFGTKGFNYPLGNYIWNKVYPAKCFQKVRFPIGKVFEDIYIDMELFLQVENFIIIPDLLYYYRQRSDSIVHCVPVKKDKINYIEALVNQRCTLSKYPDIQIKCNYLIARGLWWYYRPFLQGWYEITQEDVCYIEQLVSEIFTSHEVSVILNKYTKESYMQELEKYRECRKSLEKSKKDLDKCKKQLSASNENLKKTAFNELKTRKELENIKSGLSFKIGRMVTWLPRKLVGRK